MDTCAPALGFIVHEAHRDNTLRGAAQKLTGYRLARIPRANN